MILPITGEFSGTDDVGSKAAIEASHPGYGPPDATLLGAALEGDREHDLAEAAIGAGIPGYVIGRRHGAAVAMTPIDRIAANQPLARSLDHRERLNTQADAEDRATGKQVKLRHCTRNQNCAT